jgi:hypothetical protein
MKSAFASHGFQSLAGAHLLRIIAAEVPPSIAEADMPVVLRFLKALSRGVTEAEIQRIERDLMIHGIHHPPVDRSPHH